MVVCVFFFFQAEDGIRDLVRSRGLGDVYKRQALGVFIVAFFILGYLGMQAPTPVFTIISQICTVIYFLFFLLMPWYSRIDKCQPEPERVTK